MYSSLAEGFYLKWCISKFVFCVNWCVHMFSLIYFHDGYVILYCNILGSNSILATDFHFILFLKHDAWGNSKGNKLAAECKRQACVSESLPSWERWCVYQALVSDKTLRVGLLPWDVMSSQLLSLEIWTSVDCLIIQHGLLQRNNILPLSYIWWYFQKLLPGWKERMFKKRIPRFRGSSYTILPQKLHK